MIKLLLALVLFATASLANPPEPSQLRMDKYRAPVPATLQGAKVLDAEQAHELWQRKEAIFIDVLPRAPKPKNLPKGTIWRERPRPSIPGAIWLPNVGYGALAQSTALYFTKNLRLASEGSLKTPLVFFCLSDCWMSWNAAKRAIALGYYNVYWFPDGTDGWTVWNFPTEEITPILDDQTQKD